MTSDTIQTSRLRTHYVESGPEDGIPVVLVHGNLSTGRFYEHLFEGAPEFVTRLAAGDRSEDGPTAPLNVLRNAYRDAGGRAEMETSEGSGHFPPIDAVERWSATFFAFLDSVE